MKQTKKNLKKEYPNIQEIKESVQKCFSYEEIFDHYQTVSKDIIPVHKSILKTDCYNEFIGRPIVFDSSVKMVEIDKDTVENTLQKNPKLDITIGDIRSLPFKDKEFDLVIDLSTLDHIQPDDVILALGEYSRVLSKDGELLLIVWLSEVEQFSSEWKSTCQNFFLIDKVRESLLKYFNIESEELLFKAYYNAFDYLYQFKCKKI